MAEPPGVTDSLAQYACDTCHSRKLRCTRERSGCRRCRAETVPCSYSRAGVIRRYRKRKKKDDGLAEASRPAHAALEDTERRGSLRPAQYASENNDGSTVHGRLQRLVGRDHQALRTFASLLEEHSASWQGSSAFNKLSEDAAADFLSFEEGQARVWLDAFAGVLRKESLLLSSAPSEVLDHLAASRSHRVHDRAWLVMFYSVALSVVSSSHPPDDPTKERLRSNLWLAFNDVRLLLEPSASNVQALIIMACYAEEYMTPSLCWALVNKACTMLQALGITHWRLDPPTRERHIMLFWRLNSMDKALALILGRPPTFHREMATAIALPSLDRLMPHQPENSSSGAPNLFVAHFTHQMHLLSRIMGDVWHCLHGQGTQDVHAVKENLESWHRLATQVLEAAALAESPLLDASGAAHVDLGLQTLRFHYYALLVSLTVSSKELRTQSTRWSLDLLGLLPSLGDMLSGLQGPYACLLWQFLHCPTTALGVLWADIAAKGKADPKQSEAWLKAADNLPAFLAKLSKRNALAAKLESITGRMVQSARSLLYSQDEADGETANPSSGSEAQQAPRPRRALGNNLAQQSDPAVALSDPTAPPVNVSDVSTGDDFDGQVDAWADDFLDITFDWFTWNHPNTS